MSVMKRMRRFFFSGGCSFQILMQMSFCLRREAKKGRGASSLVLHSWWRAMTRCVAEKKTTHAGDVTHPTGRTRTVRRGYS